MDERAGVEVYAIECPDTNPVFLGNLDAIVLHPAADARMTEVQFTLPVRAAPQEATGIFRISRTGLVRA